MLGWWRAGRGRQSGGAAIAFHFHMAVDKMWPVLAPPATSGPGETMHRRGPEKPPSHARAHSLQSRLACRLRMSRQGLARARAWKGDSDDVGECQGDRTPHFPDRHLGA